MSALQPSRSYRITGYSPAISNGYRQRLFSMGLLPGAALRVVRIARWATRSRSRPARPAWRCGARTSPC